MRHRVEVERSGATSQIRFSEVFNTAVPFIDRHIDEGRGPRVAIQTADGEVVSYAQLAERVGRCGNALLELGIAPGDRVMMVLHDTPTFFYLFWGAIKAGIIPVPLNTLVTATDLNYMFRDAEPAAVVYSPTFSDAVTDAVRGVRSLVERAALVFPSQGDGRSLAALIESAAPALDPAPTAPNDDCFWLYTSGSTGRPKAAVHSHLSIAVTCQRYAVETLALGDGDICYSAAKLFFAYGLGNAMTFPLWVGGRSLLATGKPTPLATFELIERFRPTAYFGVPTLYAALLEAMATAAPDLASLRLCVSAGEALPPNLLRRWQRKTGVAILDGIGSTEALHIFLSNRPDDVRPGSSGLPVPGYDARVVDESGVEVESGDSGQLLIRGDSVAKYYWNKPEKTAETFIDGWLRTGDTYVQNADGRFVYQGRSDDMMKVGGLWCSPFEIEAALVEHPDVLEVAVVARDDEHGLTKPEAWLVLTVQAAAENPTDHDLAERLRAHCQANLARYKYPRWFNVVDSLPKTATGKIQRFKLRAAHAPS